MKWLLKGRILHGRSTTHHLDLLQQGVEVWNKWRKNHFETPIDLSGADLSGANLSKVVLSYANLSEANLSMSRIVNALLSNANLSKANLSKAVLTDTKILSADLREADLTDAILVRADFIDAVLNKADLSRARLRDALLRRASLREVKLNGADLIRADLSGADLSGADLSGADLSEASFVETNLTGANLTNCSVYGISVWGIDLQGAKQDNLVITPPDEPSITVDNLEVAQFIYLLLNNAKIRDVIDTITSKVALILGRFTPERKTILDALRNELRKQNYSPVVFDFNRPQNRDFTETARTLAHMSRFILADITEPSSIPQELAFIVPELEVPVQPLLEEGKPEYSMFPDLRKYHWVFPVYRYKDQASLIASLKEEIIEPAEKRVRELAIEKARRLERP